MRATVTNQDLIINIRKSDNPVNTAMNAGSKIMDLDSNVPRFEVGKFDADQMVNILGFSHMANMNQITYDSAKEDVFLVHTPDEVQARRKSVHLQTK